MYVTRYGFWIFSVMLSCLAAAGCKKSTPPEPPPSAQAPADSQAPLLRVHWLGKKRLASETNATYLMSIWNLPESADLEAQTLDKLSTAPWRLLGKGPRDHAGAMTNPAVSGASALLRPLLNDLVQEESHFELRQPTNQPAEWALAVKLNAQQAALWQTNLGTMMAALTGSSPSKQSSSGWELNLTSSPPARIQFVKQSSWVFLGRGGLSGKTNQLLVELMARATRPSATNHWVETILDLKPAAEALNLGWKLPANSPRIDLHVTGDGENVISRAEALFPEAWPELAPWIIPTNLIRDPLSSFTAVRGLKPWLEIGGFWPRLKLGPTPDQWVAWAQNVSPYTTFASVPMADGSNVLSQFIEHLVSERNPWMTNHAKGWFERSPKGTLAWAGIPFMAPYVQAISLERDYLIGGFFPNTGTNPPPAALYEEFIGRTNAVAYGWELTGARLAQWIDIGQLLRLSLKKPQIPTSSAGLKWLLAISSKLGNCGTLITRSTPNELHLQRRSSAGMTGLELQLAVDWLESPEFPRGLHTWTAAGVGQGRVTNSAAQLQSPP